MTAAGRDVLGFYDPGPDIDLAAWKVRRHLPADLSAEDVDRWLSEQRPELERAALEARRPTPWRVVFHTRAGDEERFRTAEEPAILAVGAVGKALLARHGGTVTATVYRPGGAILRGYEAWTVRG